MTLVGFQLAGDRDDPETPWLIPSLLSADQLKQSHDLIKASEFSPPTFDDGQEAGDFIRRKSAGNTRKKAAFDDGDDEDIDDDGELMFEPGGPTAMKKSDALKALKQRRRKTKDLNDEDEDTGLSEEVLQARREARMKTERAKNNKIRSELYVKDSDDEDDEEKDRLFFEREELLRQKNKIGILKELLNVGDSSEKSKKQDARKKVAKATNLDDSDEESDSRPAQQKPKRKSKTIEISSGEEEEPSDSDDDEEPSSSATLAVAARKRAVSDEQDEEEAEETPESSPNKPQPNSRKLAKRRKVSVEVEEAAEDDNSGGVEGTLSEKVEGMQVDGDDDDEEDIAPVGKPSRQRGRTGFVVDSSDEE